MADWTVTTGTITGVVGSLITLLDTELVTNRGWTVVYSGTNKKVYRAAGGAMNGWRLRVDDNGPGAGGAKEARVRLYKTMSDVDTGTVPVPDTTHIANGVFIRKSTTADATARSYIAAGDDRTFYLFISTGDTAGLYFGFLVGDYAYRIPSDAHGVMIIGRHTENSAAATGEATAMFSVSRNNDSLGPVPTSSIASFLGGNTAGLASSTPAIKTCSEGLCSMYSSGGSSGNDALGGFAAFPNGGDNRLLLGELELVSGSFGSLSKRGLLRGLCMVAHAPSNFNDGDTFNGTGALAARSYRIVKRVQGALNNSLSLSSNGIIALETTTPEVGA